MFIITDATNRPDIQAGQSWYVFNEFMDMLDIGFSALSHLVFIADLARGEGGLFFAFLCIVRPLLKPYLKRDLWATSKAIHSFLGIAEYSISSDRLYCAFRQPELSSFQSTSFACDR